MPDYTKYDPKGYGGDPKRGAALGRSCIIDEEDPANAKRHLLLRPVTLDEGYDCNGTYWGDPSNLWWCVNDDDHRTHRLQRGVLGRVHRRRCGLPRRSPRR